MRFPRQLLTPQTVYVSAAVLFAADRLLKYAALSGQYTSVGRAFAFRLFMNNGIAFSIPLSEVVFWPFAIVVFGLLSILYVVGFRGGWSSGSLMGRVGCPGAQQIGRIV